MSDESFFREVNEDVRSERIRSFWSRFGTLVVAVVIIVVAATAGWAGWEYWQGRQASRSGDAFLAALTDAREGRTDEALTSLEDLEENGFGAYPALARMRAATLKAEASDYGSAIEDFRAIGEDGDIPAALREAARIRAAYLMVDHASYDDVLAVVNDMTGDDHPMRHSAREALGLAAWNAEDAETATEWFERIVSDDQAMPGVARRADIMLEVIAAHDPDSANPAPSAEDALPQAPLSLDELAPGLAPGGDIAPEGTSPASETETQPSAEGEQAPAATGGNEDAGNENNPATPDAAPAENPPAEAAPSQPAQPENPS